MTRQRFIWDKRSGDWMRVGDNVRPRPRIHIISDTHQPFRSMADGHIYDSKSQYRRTLKDKGFVELGSDHACDQAPRYDEGDIAQDIADAMNGNVAPAEGVEAPQGFDMGAIDG